MPQISQDMEGHICLLRPELLLMESLSGFVFRMMKTLGRSYEPVSKEVGPQSLNSPGLGSGNGIIGIPGLGPCDESLSLW